jgi:hypothetical protein
VQVKEGFNHLRIEDLSRFFLDILANPYEENL